MAYSGQNSDMSVPVPEGDEPRRERAARSGAAVPRPARVRPRVRVPQPAAAGAGRPADGAGRDRRSRTTSPRWERSPTPSRPASRPARCTGARSTSPRPCTTAPCSVRAHPSTGPALIEEPFTVVAVAPGWTCTLGAARVVRVASDRRLTHRARVLRRARARRPRRRRRSADPGRRRGRAGRVARRRRRLHRHVARRVHVRSAAHLRRRSVLRDVGAATRRSSTGCRSGRWKSSRGAPASKARRAGPSASSTVRSSDCSSATATGSRRSVADFASMSTPTSRTVASTSILAFKRLLYEHACEGMYGDPVYGGNRDYAGWDAIGWIGDIQPRGYTDEEVSRAREDGDPSWPVISTATPSSSDPGRAGRRSPTCSPPRVGR